MTEITAEEANNYSNLTHDVVEDVYNNGPQSIAGGLSMLVNVVLLYILQAVPGDSRELALTEFLRVTKESAIKNGMLKGE